MDEITTRFRANLKATLLERLALDDKTPDDIHDEQPLLKGGLCMDSIDVVDVIIALERKYGISTSTFANRPEILATFATLSDFVQANSTKPPRQE